MNKNNDQQIHVLCIHFLWLHPLYQIEFGNLYEMRLFSCNNIVAPLKKRYNKIVAFPCEKRRMLCFFKG